MARAIHYRSPRRDKPFVEVSCGALPETLLESELFGHVKGAFTGAIADKMGRFMAADDGTIFLDEINSASPAFQVKLLRFLQERQFEPVGSNDTRTVDVRVVLATNVDLAQLVTEQKFRQDLFLVGNPGGDRPPTFRRSQHGVGAKRLGIEVPGGVGVSTEQPLLRQIIAAPVRVPEGQGLQEFLGRFASQFRKTRHENS